MSLPFLKNEVWREFVLRIQRAWEAEQKEHRQERGRLMQDCIDRGLRNSTVYSSVGRKRDRFVYAVLDVVSRGRHLGRIDDSRPERAMVRRVRATVPSERPRLADARSRSRSSPASPAFTHDAQ